MFESIEIRHIRRSPAFWLSLALCAIAVLFTFNLVRVNLPERSRSSSAPFVQPHTGGAIASEIARIEAGGFLPFRANFNHRVTVKGKFSVDREGPWISFLIVDGNNFEKWRSGNEFNAAVSTGRVPAGRISRVLEPGTYFMIFDNRSSEKEVVVDIDLAAN